MSDQNNNLLDGQEKKDEEILIEDLYMRFILPVPEDILDQAELWSGRYYVGAEVERWPHRGGVFRDVEILLFQRSMPEDELKALLDSLALSPELPGYDHIFSQIEQTFTEEQADGLIAYLEGHDGTKAWKKPAYKPIENGIGLGACPVGGPTDFFMLHNEEDYNLNFKAEAYYDVEYAEWSDPTQEIQLDDMSEQEEKLKRKIRMNVSIDIRSLSLKELNELQDWLDEKKTARIQAQIDEILKSL